MSQPKSTRKPLQIPAKARGKVITAEEAAAFDFEAWEGAVDTGKLPNNEEFTEDGLDHLITSRLALSLMYKTKAELIEIFADAGNEEAVDVLFRRIKAADEFFSHFLKLLNGCLARLVVAGSNVELTMTKRKAGNKITAPGKSESRAVTSINPKLAALAALAAKLDEA